MENWINSLMLDQTTEGIRQIPTVGNFAAGLLFAALMAAVMCGIYKCCHDSLSYSRKFNVTLIMMALLSTVLLNLIQSNILLSLGVLGSLSICRFRTNTKDPRDIGFVFWSLAIGISSGTGSYINGLACTAVLSLLMLATGGSRSIQDKVTLVIRGKNLNVNDVGDIIEWKRGKSRMLSKNIHQDFSELVYEVKLRGKEEQELLERLQGMQGIDDIHVLAPETKVA